QRLLDREAAELRTLGDVAPLLADSACRANRRARNRAVCSRIASSLAWYSAIACRPSRPCSFLNSAGLLTIRSGSTQREPSPLRGNKIVPLLLTRAVATTCHFCRRYVVHNGRASKGTSACPRRKIFCRNCGLNLSERRIA